MKPTIILVAISAFAAAVNKAIAASDLALKPQDIAIADGKVCALLVPQPGIHPSATGSLVEVSVIKGEKSKVEAEVAAAMDKDPYLRPARLLVLPAGKKDAEDSTKGPVVAVILGKYQP